MIELVPGAQQINCKIYPLSSEEPSQLDEFLKENVESGRIRPSKSPMASLFFFIKNKDEKLRPVQDYQKLNKIVRDDFQHKGLSYDGAPTLSHTNNEE